MRNGYINLALSEEVNIECIVPTERFGPGVSMC